MITDALLQELGNNRQEPEVKSLAAELRRRNIPFRFFLEKQLQRGQLQLQPTTLVAGHIPVVMSALRQIGVNPPPPDDYPTSLRPWLHRRTWTSTVKDVVHQLQEGVSTPFFAKPLGRFKRFRGHIFSSWDDLRALGGASDNTELACSEEVHWKTEHRIYVVEGGIVGIRHYLGDSNISPDHKQVDQAVSTFESSGEAPAGYGIDFGVLENGQTALVEVNDGYSLGSYGLEDHHYANLIIARWHQLMEPLSRPKRAGEVS